MLRQKREMDHPAEGGRGGECRSRDERANWATGGAPPLTRLLHSPCFKTFSGPTI